MKTVLKRECCHDCGVIEGQIHQYGCDMEICPFCGHQLITCDCCYDYLGFKNIKKYPATYGLSPEIYSKGLPQELKAKWLKMLENKGRIPYIQYPNMCCRCGELWPDFFEVPNEEWEGYIEPKMRGKVLCRRCYDWIRQCIELDRKGECEK